MDRIDAAVDRVAALDDPVRRAMYRYVRERRRPVTRDEVATAVGASRKLAAFHLDKLVERGLLAAGYQAAGERGGGAGRPAKTYEPAGALDVSLPERRYDLVGDVLVRAVAAGGRAAERAVVRAAAERGRELGGERRGRGGLAAAKRALADLGFEPRDEGRSRVVLDNCPFHALAAEAPALVCGLNRALVGGLLDGLGAAGVAAELDPAPGRCCVVLRRAT